MAAEDEQEPSPTKKSKKGELSIVSISWYLLVVTVPVVFLEPSLHAKPKPKTKSKAKKQPDDSASAVALPANLNRVDAQKYDHIKAQTAKVAATAATSQLAGSTSKHAALSAPVPLSTRADVVEASAIDSTEAVLQGMVITILVVNRPSLSHVNLIGDRPAHSNLKNSSLRDPTSQPKPRPRPRQKIIRVDTGSQQEAGTQPTSSNVNHSSSTVSQQGPGPRREAKDHASSHISLSPATNVGTQAASLSAKNSGSTASSCPRPSQLNTSAQQGTTTISPYAGSPTHTNQRPPESVASPQGVQAVRSGGERAQYKAAQSGGERAQHKAVTILKSQSAAVVPSRRTSPTTSRAASDIVRHQLPAKSSHQPPDTVHRVARVYTTGRGSNTQGAPAICYHFSFTDCQPSCSGYFKLNKKSAGYIASTRP